MSDEKEQAVELNEDTIIHVVRQLNQRGISAHETIGKGGKVAGLTITRGDKVDNVPFGHVVTFHEGRDVRVSSPVVELKEEVKPLKF